MTNSEKSKVLMLLSLITQIGIVIVVNLLICLYLGKLMDNIFNTKNIYTVVFLFLGAISALVNTYSTLTRSAKNDEKRKREEN